MTTSTALPRLYTAKLLDMSGGDRFTWGDVGDIDCLREGEFVLTTSDHGYRHHFAYDSQNEVWVAARWDEDRAQWRCYDLRPEYESVYAYARRLHQLWGVRTYMTAGALLRKSLTRPY